MPLVREWCSWSAEAALPRGTNLADLVIPVAWDGNRCHQEGSKQYFPQVGDTDTIRRVPKNGRRVGHWFFLVLIKHGRRAWPWGLRRLDQWGGMGFDPSPGSCGVLWSCFGKCYLLELFASIVIYIILYTGMILLPDTCLCSPNTALGLQALN